MRMRYLKPNKGTTLPGEVAYLGVSAIRHKSTENPNSEAITFQHFWCRFERLTNGTPTRCTTIQSSNPDTFWAALSGRASKHRPITVFVYDATQAVTLLGLWERLDRGLYKAGVIIDTDPPVIINILSGLGRIVFVDVRNYFYMPLEQLGDSFDVPVLGFNQIKQENWEEGAEASYRQRVAEVAISSLMSFVQRHDLGRWKTTIGMQALQCFRHRFAPRKIRVTFQDKNGNPAPPVEEVKVFPLAHDDSEIKKFERSANYSGHDECFFVGNVIEPRGFFSGEAEYKCKRNAAWLYGPVYFVDINSLHAYVMKAFQYPKRLAGWQKSASPAHLDKLFDRYLVIARVLLNTKEETFPLKYKDRIIHPTGRYWTTLCGRELEYAYECGYIEAVSFHTAYEPMDLFSEYVDYFFAKKVEAKSAGNRAMELIAKMLLNTLQGKFSQRSKRWIEKPKTKARHRWGKWLYIDGDACLRNEELARLQRTIKQPGRKAEKELYKYRAIAGATQELVDDSELAYSVPAIGAFVTSNARYTMMKHRKVAGKGNILYQGTDSLILLEPGYRNLVEAGLIDSTKLGHFRFKGEFASAVIRDTQDYELGESRTMRGLPKDAIKVSDNEYVFQNRVSLQGMLFSKPGESIYYSTIRRTFAHFYAGGTVHANGFVEPFEMKMEGSENEPENGNYMATEEAESVAVRSQGSEGTD